jgi:transglutaminase superfamily protein
MLGRRGLDSTIRLGVAKDADGNLQAHAWLCAGDAILTGGAQVRRFEPLADLE